jgi:hypothetical protein
VGLRAGLNDVEKTKFLTIPRVELGPLCRPVRSRLLYRLRYAGFLTTVWYPGSCRGVIIGQNDTGLNSRHDDVAVAQYQI